MYYIAKYISKEENVILRPDIKDALSAINDAPQKEFVSKVMKATKLITSHRVRSGQETAYVTVSLPLRGSTHSTVFVNTRGRDKRNRILRKECINNDEQTEFSESDFASDIFDKYARRPHELESISLAEFAQLWVVRPNAKFKDTLEDSEGEEGEELEVPSVVKTRKRAVEYCLLNSRTIIYKRASFACLKTPFISHIEEPEAYYYSLILLYMPFRDEDNLLQGYANAKECFKAKFDMLQPGNILITQINRREELLRALERVNLLSVIEPEQGVENLVEGDGHHVERVQSEDNQEFPVQDLVESANIQERIKVLNVKQRTAYNEIIKHIVENIKDPMFLCLHGSGGTGKSFVARIVLDLINIHYGCSQKDGLLVCIVGAPTGVAAKNIGGMTLHRAFRLPIEKWFLGEYKKLHGKVLMNINLLSLRKY